MVTPRLGLLPKDVMICVHRGSRRLALPPSWVHTGVNRHFPGYLSMYFGPSILLCHLPLRVPSGGAGRFCLLCGSRIV